MKTMHVGMVAVTLLSSSIPLTMTQCSSSDATATPDGGHPGNSGSGSGGSTSSGGSGSGGGAPSSGSGSGGSSGGTTSDDGGGTSVNAEGGTGNAEGGASSGGTSQVTCQAPDGGAACDPGMVACGNTMCDTSQTSCCRATGDGGTDQCVGPNGACTGTLVRCNETSDCAKGLVCCDTYGATSCMASCGAYAIQICRSDTECGLDSDAGAAKKCIVQTCGGGPAPGGGPSTPAVTIEACAAPVYTGMGMPAGWGATYGCTAK
jgi:hypothetical protein